jgi:hypothetical protein
MPHAKRFPAKALGLAVPDRSMRGKVLPYMPPSSRIGENPPYGMIGRVEETSASFEARSTPRLYPTAGGCDETHVPTGTL